MRQPAGRSARLSEALDFLDTRGECISGICVQFNKNIDNSTMLQAVLRLLMAHPTLHPESVSKEKRWHMTERIAVTVFLIATAFSCEESDGVARHDASSMTGSWLLVERGYSPGAGYFTEPVSPIPPQLLMLQADSTMSTTMESLQSFRYYRRLEGADGEVILALFKEDPGNQSLDIDHLDQSFAVSFKEGMLKLSFRGCIEGCHLGFVRSGGNDG